MKHSTEDDDNCTESTVEERAFTPTEEIVAEVWADILNIPEADLTPTSNFFEVGGHSLLLFDVIMGIKQEVDIVSSWTITKPFCFLILTIHFYLYYFQSNPDVTILLNIGT